MMSYGILSKSTLTNLLKLSIRFQNVVKSNSNMFCAIQVVIIINMKCKEKEQILTIKFKSYMMYLISLEINIIVQAYTFVALT